MGIYAKNYMSCVTATRTNARFSKNYFADLVLKWDETRGAIEEKGKIIPQRPNK